MNILLVTPSGAKYESHRNGAVLGQTEGNIQGQFLGIHYQLDSISFEQALGNKVSPSALVFAGTIEELNELLSIFSPKQVPIFNIALVDNALREDCLEGVYHTTPSDKMLADAVAQWQQQNPDESVSAQAWHHDFVKFAGRDLNRRYREQFGVPMDSDAWAGWVATRIVAEAVVRIGSNDPAQITSYLDETLAFDGQKGVPHDFRPNGQLRQPLLLVDGEGTLLGEAPVRGVANSTDLDSLGLASCL